MSDRHRIHTSDHRAAQAIWVRAGGNIKAVRRTGEIRYRHPSLAIVLTVNGRRSDTPMIVLRHLNKLLRDNSVPYSKKGV